jgi:type 1 glutamine amidotransferase
VILILLTITATLFGAEYSASNADSYRERFDMPGDSVSILIFSKTSGYRHESIEAGVRAITEIMAESASGVYQTEDASAFSDDSLAKYDVVIFLNTTGTLFDQPQRAAFKRFIQGGGGFVGIHSASDTEYDWPWYGKLVGAYFESHPHIQEARLFVDDRNHPSTAHLSEEWRRTDEWYNFQSAPEGVNVIMRLDPESFEGGTMGSDHPIAWYHEYDGGRSVYTAGGHTEESFAELAFRQHLLGAILWAARKR